VKRLVASCTLIAFIGSGCATFVPAHESGTEQAWLAVDEPAPPAEESPPPAEERRVDAPSDPSATPADSGPAPTASAELSPAAETETKPGTSGPLLPSANGKIVAADVEPITDDKHQRARTAVFWTGIGAIALGGAGMIAFGVTGRVTQAQLGNGYEDGLTHAREDQLERRAEISNGLAIAGGTLAVVGLAMSVIAYAVDYNRCGALSRRRYRKDCRPS